MLRKNKKLKLIIIGNGYQKKSLHDLSIKLNLENDILFIKSTSNVYFFLKYSSIFVCSSLWEGTPTILAEALKTQIPIVTSNFPSAYELLSDSTNFRIAKRNNSKDLSKKINEILSKNYVKNKNQMWKNLHLKISRCNLLSKFKILKKLKIYKIPFLSFFECTEPCFLKEYFLFLI